MSTLKQKMRAHRIAALSTSGGGEVRETFMRLMEGGLELHEVAERLNVKPAIVWDEVFGRGFNRAKGASRERIE